MCDHAPHAIFTVADSFLTEEVFNHPWLSMCNHNGDSNASPAADSVDVKDTSYNNFSIRRFLNESDNAQGDVVSPIERTPTVEETGLRIKGEFR